ncbi:MAG: hypothetical protein OXF47_10680, partial [Nitrospira sp.]|nr:hypothetical protein [Nitrospira sp.]
TRASGHPELVLLVLSEAKDLAKDLLFQAFGGRNNEIPRQALHFVQGKLRNDNSGMVSISFCQRLP